MNELTGYKDINGEEIRVGDRIKYTQIGSGVVIYCKVENKEDAKREQDVIDQGKKIAWRDKLKDIYWQSEVCSSKDKKKGI